MEVPKNTVDHISAVIIIWDSAETYSVKIQRKTVIAMTCNFSNIYRKIWIRKTNSMNWTV